MVNARGRELAAQAQKIYAELDGRQLALFPGTGGATDAGFAGQSGKAAVVESFGLSGFGYHARDEYIELDSIVPRALPDDAHASGERALSRLSGLGNLLGDGVGKARGVVVDAVVLQFTDAMRCATGGG